MESEGDQLDDGILSTNVRKCIRDENQVSKSHTGNRRGGFDGVSGGDHDGRVPSRGRGYGMEDGILADGGIAEEVWE